MKNPVRSFLVSALIATIMSLPSLALARGHSSHSSGPNYGGGHHTSSHGGHYAGGHGSSHRGGHYVNAKTGNHYGHHKP